MLGSSTDTQVVCLLRTLVRSLAPPEHAAYPSMHTRLWRPAGMHTVFSTRHAWTHPV